MEWTAPQVVRVDEPFVAGERAMLAVEQEAARRAVAELPLDAIFVSPRWGDMHLRWAYLHMIGEYAQHNGHADLLRERIDGAARK